MPLISTQKMQQFAEVCLNAKKPEEIAVPLTRLLDSVSILHWYAGTLVHENDLDRVGWGFFGMPMGWQKQYADENYSEDDDVFQFALENEHAAFWSSIHQRVDAVRGKPSARALTVREEARRIGLHDGYIRPMRSRNDLPAAVTFGGEEIDTSPEGLATYELLAAYAYEGFRRYSIGFKAIAPYLSPREYEVLCWSAEGKSAWDIGQILSIAESTVREYQKSLRMKYRSSTMTRVVVIAALNRTITTLPSLARAA
jgi:LuxR family quorum sensing-dependent transcriptional regulator